jgi:hypothetical protein
MSERCWSIDSELLGLSLFEKSNILFIYAVSQYCYEIGNKWYSNVLDNENVVLIACVLVTFHCQLNGMAVLVHTKRHCPKIRADFPVYVLVHTYMGARHRE